MPPQPVGPSSSSVKSGGLPAVEGAAERMEQTFPCQVLSAGP